MSWIGTVTKDEEIVARIVAGERDLFEVLLRRHSPRLYPIVVAIVGDHDEAEDVLVEAYVRAFRELPEFSGLIPFASWLTARIVEYSFARKKLSLHVALHSTGTSLFALRGHNS